jgi:hypothetical protein
LHEGKNIIEFQFSQPKKKYEIERIKNNKYCQKIKGKIKGFTGKEIITQSAYDDTKNKKISVKKNFFKIGFGNEMNQTVSGKYFCQHLKNKNIQNPQTDFSACLGS